MAFVETGIEGLKIFEPKIWGDARGYFFESYNETVFKDSGIDAIFVQDNQSRSMRGVLRGLHYQLPPFTQAKLVRCIYGKVLDVVVDIREGSPTYGKSFSVILSAQNKRQLFVPCGFAHGFVVLSKEAEFFYKCDNMYASKHEAGVAYNDPQLKIDWHIPLNEMILSEKDKVNPILGEHIKIFF